MLLFKRKEGISVLLIIYFRLVLHQHIHVLLHLREEKGEKGTEDV